MAERNSRNDSNRAPTSKNWRAENEDLTERHAYAELVRKVPRPPNLQTPVGSSHVPVPVRARAQRLVKWVDLLGREHTTEVD